MRQGKGDMHRSGRAWTMLDDFLRQRRRRVTAVNSNHGVVLVQRSTFAGTLQFYISTNNLCRTDRIPSPSDSLRFMQPSMSQAQPAQAVVSEKGLPHIMPDKAAPPNVEPTPYLPPVYRNCRIRAVYGTYRNRNGFLGENYGPYFYGP